MCAEDRPACTRVVGGLAPLPRLAQERLRRHHPSGVDREDAKHLVLGRGERHRAPVNRHPAPHVVDGERAEHEGHRARAGAKPRPGPMKGIRIVTLPPRTAGALELGGAAIGGADPRVRSASTDRKHRSNARVSYSHIADACTALSGAAFRLRRGCPTTPSRRTACSRCVRLAPVNRDQPSTSAGTTRRPSSIQNSRTVALSPTGV